MSVGLYDLTAINAEDEYLSGNPTITFFSKIIEKHSSFSTEVKEEDFNKTMTFGSTGSASFYSGDYLKNVYLKVRINKVDPEGTNFAWVRRLGHAMISNVEIRIGSVIIDQFNGTWLDAWYELSKNTNKTVGYSKLIGDVDELITYDDGIKPGWTMIIPLPFYFTKSIKNVLPISYFSKTPVTLNLTLAAKNTLFVRDEDFDARKVSISSVSVYGDVIYLDDNQRKDYMNFGHEFTIEQLSFSGIEKTTGLSNKYNLSFSALSKQFIWCVKNGNYLTGEQFVYYSHKSDWGDTTDGLSPFQLAACKIIKESLSIGFDPSTDEVQWLQLDDGNEYTIGNIYIKNNAGENVWFNELSLSYKSNDTVINLIDKISLDLKINSDKTLDFENVQTTFTIKDLSVPVSLMTDNRYNKNDPTVHIFSNYGMYLDGSGNGVDQCSIQFNRMDRIELNSGEYFNKIVPYLRHIGIPDKQIYTYSFSLYPEDTQSSGVDNLSKIESKIINIKLNNDAEINYIKDSNEVYIFSRNLNTLRAFKGIAGIVYNS